MNVAVIPPLPDTTSTTSATETGSSTGGSTDTGTSTGTGEGGTTGTEGGTTGSDTSACPSVYAPVCGKDGETYDNACVVPQGVGIRRDGPCVGDCEGSCAVVGDPGTSMMLAVAVLLMLRRRRC